MEPPGCAEVMQQNVAELRDCKHVHQVEKELLPGHAGMMSVALAQQRMYQVGIFRHGSLLSGSFATAAGRQRLREWQ